MYQKELTQKVHVNRKAFSVRLMAHFILLCSLAINHSFIATFVPLQMFSIAQSVIDHTSFVSRWVRFLLLLLFLIIIFSVQDAVNRRFVFLSLDSGRSSHPCNQPSVACKVQSFRVVSFTLSILDQYPFVLLFVGVNVVVNVVVLSLCQQSFRDD